jgi:predicted 3-demethylubiquinone-9 3-methyltransferase (glyoxalase superfamily)
MDDRRSVMPAITPNLWFDDQSLDAAEFYTSTFPNSKVMEVTYYGRDQPRPEGSVLTVNFLLDGQEFTAINGGPMFTFSEAVSFLINCADQKEIDYYWDKLTADGGEESQCGWLKDKFGLSWQVVPADWAEKMTDPDQARVQRMMQAMFTMKKLDIAALEAAADGR